MFTIWLPPTCYDLDGHLYTGFKPQTGGYIGLLNHNNHSGPTFFSREIAGWGD